MHDYHAHSAYSDGEQLHRMLDAAADAGLDGVGFADHCSLTRDPHWREQRARYARTFDLTYERRRTAIEALRADRDIAVHDAVEVDYEPGADDRIGAFLADADFDYAVGSVHYVLGHTVFAFEDFSTPDTPDPDAVVDAYYDAVVSLLEAELFEVAAHLDVIEAHPQLAGRRTKEQVRRVADAAAASRTVPEINAKRLLREDGPDLHPTGALRTALSDRGVSFTVGTDAHGPEAYDGRARELERFCEDAGIDPVAPTDLAA
ncbi:histidinol-phosphatase [Halobaculum sp. WSA2]|uniref:histidinol-phosphatase n=1 Tax=Halobaculum saliterrae TaxID=2073113 RepID=A0A6B0SV42_9EURY|nr:PHP domain-containing protein [Halobaculum saliterrae]MXR42764.1 histidinol-phosphatase [Halobaculum saliterrae]